MMLILPTFAQQPTDLYLYDTLTLDLTIKGNLEIKLKKDEGYVQYLTAELGLYPKNEQRQKVLEFSTTAREDNGTLLFTWNYPKETVEFSVKAKVKNYANPIEVREKITFPFQIKDEEINRYLQETEMIDYSVEEIRTLATELVTGSDDAYEVAVTLAEWVRTNIRYNLTTTTAEATQSASWVLENRYGVCDELTNLYIALLRSVGIPARFVTGISYTTSDLFAEPWNAHGWAEVYFPEYGWIPFDVTYGQYSFSDPTHIALQHAIDSQQTSLSYQWKGQNADVQAGMLDFDVNVVEYGQKTVEPVEISATVYKKEIGFGSYNIMTATIKNNDSYYVPVHLFLALSKEITTNNITQTILLLEPNEEQTTTWIMYINESLNPAYIYTFNPIIYTLRNLSTTASFQAYASGPVIDKEMIEYLRKKWMEEEEKIYSKNINLKCDISSNKFYPDVAATIFCNITNMGNIIQQINICFKEDCQIHTLRITETKQINFVVNDSEYGTHLGIIEAKNSDVTKVDEIEYTILDKPKITIININHESEGKYNTEIPLTITLEQKSLQIPQNILVELQYGNRREWMQIAEMRQQVNIEIALNTKDFRDEITTVRVIVHYEDITGEPYEEEKVTEIVVVEFRWWQKLRMIILKTLRM